MKRILILGRGGSGKSTLALRLSRITGLPVIELDKIFWGRDPTPMSKDEWEKRQQCLVAEEGWIMDGDLGPYDAIEVRLRAADTIIVLNFSLLRCAWQAVRRSRERPDFWRWLVTYRGQSLPRLMQAIAEHAAGAKLHIFRDPRSVAEFLASCGSVYNTRGAKGA